MSKYRVKNLRQGGSPVPSGFKSWLDYWEKAVGEKAYFCHNSGCPGSLFVGATDGAHVQLEGFSDKRWYVVPLCHRCNCQFGARLEVAGPLVSVTDPKIILW